MDTSALKSFAPAVRRQLMEAVTRKLDYVLTADTPDLRAAAEQVKSLRQEAGRDRAGLIERVAYTWFNRFAALRFMDARGWHPFRARVLTPASAAETQPELLKLTRTGALPEELKSHSNPTRLNGLLDGRIPSPDAQGEVYRYLVLAACRFYHALLPNLFEKLDDETELLLPDDLLTEHSVVHGFRTEISDNDCGDGQRANVEILGWLYQFYISERKDQVMARKSAVPTEDIPAVTQLFTPHWIVRYLVENSLGRLWLLNRPGSRLREHMPYYIDPPSPEATDVARGENNAPGGSPDDFLKITKPEEIRLCDPAVGSGHMLTYAFDLLTLIYEEEGYAPTEIPALILRHNLHGLEICPRAAQLAELALVFKARQSSRRFFQPEHLVRPHIIELRDVRFAENELRDYICALGLGDLFNQPMLRLLHQFEEAKNFGSLIQPCLDERAIADVRRAIEAKDLGGQLFLRETHLKVLRVLEQAEALTQRYHVVVANPPYMGSGNMNAKLKTFASALYPLTKGDLFSMFVEQGVRLLVENGFLAQITMHSWMFLSSFSKMRTDLVLTYKIETCIHIGYNSFPELNSKVAQAAAFVICNSPSGKSGGKFFDLNSAPQSADKQDVFAAKRASGECYIVTNSQFRAIPGAPLAYWASPGILRLFSSSLGVGEKVEARQGLITANNDRFLRRWWEGVCNTILFPADYREDARRGKKWFPYNKGGDFRKWYGNAEYVVNWENDGEAIKGFVDSSGDQLSRPQNTQFYFRESISWSDVTTDWNSFRWYPAGFIFDATGHSAFPPKEEVPELLAYLNTRIVQQIAKLLNPTIHFHVGYFRLLPFTSIANRTVNDNANSALSIARADWDNFETSWDFRDQPLLRPGLKGATLEASWRNWEAQSTAAIRRMQELETENNRLFIAAYGLDGELQPEVPEAQITLARAEARRDMAAFLSYAVGCMMGRYSPDHPGLILANAGDSLREFLEKVGKPLAELTFAPDEDGIIPVLDGEWFEDDIVARSRDFLRATFGAKTLEQNVQWIAEALGKDLRKYFLTDFYKDHLQTYKKRPIYWMVSSPKGSFQAVFYLHRYTRDTVNTLLNKYLREYLHKLEARVNQLTHTEATTTSAREKSAARKEADKLRKSLKECQDWEREVVLPLAQKRIDLDLDEGVKVNYQRFPGLLAKIPGFDQHED
jgi:hypothetical protein